MQTIKPKILKGFKDTLPGEAIIKNKFLKVITHNFEKYGFSPIDTPALEYIEILTGKSGEESEKLMYKFEDNGGRTVGLRYDLTVPLARFTAMNINELTLPFKRYHIAPVWRAENPQKGRFREFYQCDCDIVGTDSYLADTEILFLIHNIFSDLKIDDFIIQVNSRVFIDLLFKKLQISDDMKTRLAILIDKIDKMEKEKFKNLYTEMLENTEKISIFEKYIYEIKNIEDIKILFSNEIETEKEKKAVDDFEKLLEASFSIKSRIRFSPHIIRGLDYYTSIVFETILENSPQYGAVFSGGRYDGLIGMFSGSNIPATGASIGISRLIALLTERGFFGETPKTVSDIIVLNLSENHYVKYIEIVQMLRNQGYNCDLYYSTDKIKKQFKYAQSKDYSFAVIMGEEEIEKNIVQ
ncbi:MAG: histidine--tRNA ligase, partial [Candidatus Muiribacteriota bacterium]